MMRSISFGTRILVLVPHPDDEVVACSATIGRAQAAGSTVFAAYLTHGCVPLKQLWPWQRKRHAEQIQQRHEEARLVAQRLGITPAFWSRRPARHLWRQLPQVLGEVLHLIEKHQIDQIWVPAYEGGNADHDGLNAVGAQLATMVSVLEFAEYNWFGGTSNSHRFPYPTPETITLELTPEERTTKVECLALYASEQRTLSYVETQRESFRRLVDYDYQKPPHPGLLWYMRFQWVPFHHPGVDRARQSQVSRMIRAFQHTISAVRR